MPERNTENRSDVRLQHSARIVLEDFEGGLMYEARMVNYSKKGIYFESDFYLVPGIEIQSRVDRREKTGKSAESRRHVRKPCAIPTLIEDKKRHVRGEILDASQGGVFIKCDQPVPVGHKVSLMIPLKKKQKLVVRVGEVVRSDSQGIGIKFQPHPPHKSNRS